jgi:F-type H+-transporting ATPase subunit delta
MKQANVAKRYAKALFEVARDHKMLSQIEKELEYVVNVLNSTPELKKWLQHPHTDLQKKRELFSNAFKQLQKYTRNFLLVLVDRRREDLLEDIWTHYKKMMNDELGIAEAVVTTPFPMTAEDREQLIQIFEPMVGKKLKIKEVVDPELLGGVVVQVGDRLYDGSLKTKLVRFQERLKGSKVS